MTEPKPTKKQRIRELEQELAQTRQNHATLTRTLMNERDTARSQRDSAKSEVALLQNRVETYGRQLTDTRVQVDARSVSIARMRPVVMAALALTDEQQVHRYEVLRRAVDEFNRTDPGRKVTHTISLTVGGPISVVRDEAAKLTAAGSEVLGVDSSDEPRPWFDLTTSGLLWRINATTFHPHGFALAMVVRDGVAVGWKLKGNGREPWRFVRKMDKRFLAAEATLEAARERNTR